MCPGNLLLRRSTVAQGELQPNGNSVCDGSGSRDELVRRTKPCRKPASRAFMCFPPGRSGPQTVMSRSVLCRLYCWALFTVQCLQNLAWQGAATSKLLRAIEQALRLSRGTCCNVSSFACARRGSDSVNHGEENGGGDTPCPQSEVVIASELSEIYITGFPRDKSRHFACLGRLKHLVARFRAT